MLNDLLFDVSNLVLLFSIRFHLVDLVLGLCADVGGVVTGIVDHLLFYSEIHDVCADGVHEILGVGGDDEDVVVGGEVSFEPDDGAEIEMIGGLVEEEEMGLDEERAGEGDAHAPTTGHVFCGLFHHGGGEPETVEDAACLCLERVGVHLLELFVCSVEGELVNVVCD